MHKCSIFVNRIALRRLERSPRHAPANAGMPRAAHNGKSRPTSRNGMEAWLSPLAAHTGKGRQGNPGQASHVQAAL